MMTTDREIAQREALRETKGKSKSASLNRSIGILIPLLLLLYIAFAYFIVVTQYSYHYLYLENNASSHPIVFGLWFVFIHTLLLNTLINYLRVFQGAAPPSLPHDPPPAVQRKRIIFECDQDGNPLRCWRDACNGRWKPPRTRHCGTCKVCRPGFDHHCVWFNADITAPDTIRAFLLTTFLAPTLIIFALAPISPICLKHILLIWESARTHPAVHKLWWQYGWWTWLGGPWTHYGWGFIIGAWLYPKHSAPVMQTDSSWLARPNLGIVLLFFCGAAISLVCIGLLGTTLVALAKADLTVDNARRKTSARISSRNPIISPTSTESTTLLLPLGTNFFWVPSQTGQEASDDSESTSGSVVACHPDEQPYSRQEWGQNLRMMLALPPFDRIDRLTSWPISTAWRARLQERATTNLSSQRTHT
ncbi:hypothetical protein CF326_g3807 [Tilletia indica]|nr:hypothetical protein CF326_g3807 [Tilletia indica]